LDALVKEIKGNISQLTETEFNKTLNEVLNRQRTWFAKGASIRVASSTDEGYLYQYLLDHAYTIFVTKGYVLELQESEYVKGGTFGKIAEFYLNCAHFNHDSFELEKRIVSKIAQPQQVSEKDPDVIKLKELRRLYSIRLNENMGTDAIRYLEDQSWDFRGEVFTITFIVICLFVIFS
jgi:hypothetical protein